MSDRDVDGAMAIIELTVELGRTPTVKELGARLGLGQSGTHSRIDRLREEGFLRRGDRQIAIEPLHMPKLADAIRFPER